MAFKESQAGQLSGESESVTCSVGKLRTLAKISFNLFMLNFINNNGSLDFGITALHIVRAIKLVLYCSVVCDSFLSESKVCKKVFGRSVFSRGNKFRKQLFYS